MSEKILGVPTSADVEKNKIMAVLAYILFIIPLLGAKDSPFVMYHANQGLILFLFALAANIILGIIPIIGWLLLPVANLVVLILAIIGIINAANGEMKPLPVIGKYQLLKY
jgi:uncharacterized membrane protein